MKFSFLILNYNVITIHLQYCSDVGLRRQKIRAGACKTKRGSRGKAPGGRGATTGGAESEKRGEGGREEEIGGGIAEASGGGETTERGSGETDEGRGGTTEAKKGGQRLPSGSGSTGGGSTSTAKELVEGNESGTSGVSPVREGDEFDRPTPFDKKATGPVSSQGDSGAMPGAGRNGERVGNRANGWGKSVQEVRKFWYLMLATRPSISFVSLEYFLADFHLRNATSCSSCARAKAACKPFDADGARRKAKEETARRAQARKTKQRTDAEWKEQVLEKLGKVDELVVQVRRVADVLERMAGVRSKTPEDDIISWPESGGEETETVERMGKGKGREVVEEECDNEPSEMDIENGEDESNRMEEVEEVGTPVAYSVGTG